MKRVWNEHLDSLLYRHYPKGDISALAARLGTTVCAVKGRARILGIRRKVNTKRMWTERQIAYLVSHYADTPIDVLVRRTRHTQKSIWGKARGLGLRKSREFLQAVGHHCAQHPRSVATRFVKGQEPHNKGKRIGEFMSAEGIERSSSTRFKKGHLPHNTRPIGYERVDPIDGYTFIKVSMSGKMVAKHRYVWEQAHGKVPDGCVVSFRDGNRRNCDLSNLYLLSREDVARRRVLAETPEARRARIAKATVTRNKSIRRDKIRIHWGMEPIGKLVKKW